MTTATKTRTANKKTTAKPVVKKSKTIPPAAINSRQAKDTLPQTKKKQPSMMTVVFTVLLFIIVMFTIEGLLGTDVNPYQAPGDEDEFRYEVNTAQPE